VARRRPFRRLDTNGAETGWRRFNHQGAALHKVNKARRQRELENPLKKIYYYEITKLIGMAFSVIIVKNATNR
jgi:hypothetical protein